MNDSTFTIILGVGLFLGMLFSLQIGHLLSHRILPKNPNMNKEGFDVIHGALFALLGLLVAFTFSGAYQRYEQRRMIIVNETNAIGTAYLRLDLLPTEVQPILQEKFRTYTDTRIALYQKLLDKNEARKEQEKTQKLQQEIWDLCIKSTVGLNEKSTRILLLPTLNEMIDITTTRKNTILTHTPSIIFAALIGLSFVCTFLIGIEMAKPTKLKWLQAIVFSLITALVIYIIIDLEYPHFGFIKLNKVNELLIELRNTML